jgi:dihydrofolate reductase
LARAALSLVAARARNGVIGRGGALPWRLSSDLKRFKALTMGKPTLMGRKTYDSIGKALPGRPAIVLTRDVRFRPADALVHTRLDAALAAAWALAEAEGADEVAVIGGGEIYAATLPFADRLHLTEVEADLEGDAHFPQFDATLFVETARDPFARGPKDEYDGVFRTLERRRGR